MWLSRDLSLEMLGNFSSSLLASVTGAPYVLFMSKVIQA